MATLLQLINPRDEVTKILRNVENFTQRHNVKIQKTPIVSS